MATAIDWRAKQQRLFAANEVAILEDQLKATFKTRHSSEYQRRWVRSIVRRVRVLRARLNG